MKKLYIAFKISFYQSKDPFADIANLASGLNINFNPNTLSGGKSTGHTPVGNSPFSTHFPSPTHNIAPISNGNIRAPTAQTSTSTSPHHMKTPNAFGIPLNAPSSSINSTTTTSNNTSNISSSSIRPDYSRSHFEASKSNQNTNTSSASTKNSDIFADILGEQGYKFTSKTNAGPRSINEMRKDETVKDMDPKKLKIMEWV